MVKWTAEQADAIFKEGSRIIVSAGAGSGKTAVLTERVIRKLKTGIHINKLLILTFTKAAAQEMKERIRASIKTSENLKEELDLIDSAYITTFDSFALSIVKKYHYLKNITNKVKIAESTVISLEKRKILDNIFDELYQEENHRFLNFIDTFCVKDDELIRKSILKMNDRLDMKYDKIDYLKNYIDNFYNLEKINQDINNYQNLIFENIEQIKVLLENLSNYVELDFYYDFFNALNGLINAKDYNDIKNNLDITLPRMKKNSLPDASDIKKLITEEIKKIKALCPYENIDEIKESILQTKDYVEVIIEIILKLDFKIKKLKRDNDLYEFNDIAQMAIEILKENDEVRYEVRDFFQEILVDEYQDTSDLQEMFISLIDNNNIYMVGDIKQSIYRFRNANPYLFKNKYENYQKGVGGYKIDLNKNFRSREEVLDDINLLFCLIMDSTLGGADYKDTHQMIFGNQIYVTDGKTTQQQHMEFLTYQNDKTSPFTKEEMEMFIIANDIKQKIASSYQVLDKKTSKLRAATYSDFVILMDRSTYFEDYKKVFEYLNIPLSIEKEESANLEDDIKTLKNLIRLIELVHDNNYQEEFRYMYLSVARSFLMNISDQDIFIDLKMDKVKESNLFKKVKTLAEKLEDYTITSLLDDIITEFNYYECLITKGSVESATIRLDYIYNLAKSLEENGYTVNSFSTYLEEVFKENIDLKFSSTKESSNSCKMMTIHKSKGLEFPICYFSGLSLKFNMSDVKENFLFDEHIGFLTPFIYQEQLAKTIYHSLLKDIYIEEEISEKIRLLYVALTRAKEKMIFLWPKDDEEVKSLDNEIVENKIRKKYRSFLDMIKSIEEVLLPFQKQVDLKNINLTKDYLQVKKTNVLEKVGFSSDTFVVNEIEKQERLKEEERTFSKKLNNLITKEEQDNIKFGKEIHDILEHIDLFNQDLDNLNVSPFVKNKIKAFLNQDLIKNNKDKRIFREYEFTYLENNIKYHGVIDLFIEKEDEIIIVDYKLKNVTDPSYIKQLSGYKNYIENKTRKKAKIYLYSIIEETFSLIEI